MTELTLDLTWTWSMVLLCMSKSHFLDWGCTIYSQSRHRLIWLAFEFEHGSDTDRIVTVSLTLCVWINTHGHGLLQIQYSSIVVKLILPRLGSISLTSYELWLAFGYTCCNVSVSVYKCLHCCMYYRLTSVHLLVQCYSPIAYSRCRPRRSMKTVTSCSLSMVTTGYSCSGNDGTTPQDPESHNSCSWA